MVSTSPIGTASTPSPGGSGSPSAKLAGGDFETFLRMLTTQIRNQDPMNPMEGADFAVQLATFSGVEQQVRTNDLLAQMAGQSGAASLNAYSDWIGKTVRTTGEVHFGEAPLLMDISPDPGADSVLLIARDAYGRVVTREDIGTGKGLVEWFGLGADGTRLPPGIYSFTLESYRGDSLLGQQKVSTYSTLQELQQNKGEITFVLEGGATASLNEINGLKQGSGI